MPGWLAIGLMSGTSTDGITAALVRFHSVAGALRPRVLACLTRPYPPRIRETLLAYAEGAAFTAAALSELNTEIGIRGSAAAAAVARRARVPIDRVDLIGSHGHTVFHGPARSPVATKPPSTFQIGEGAVIAACTGVTTVSDFRPADVAVGGQGAPLAPYAHWRLFTDRRRGRAIHNIGGIANLTYLPPGGGADDVVAFDTGPGNMVIDAVVNSVTRGRLKFDRGGDLARQGRVHSPTLEALLAHPYFRRRPPKSTGREEFGAAFVGDLLRRARRARLAPPDAVATATETTARSMADAYTQFVCGHGLLDEIYLCGGGALNRTLVSRLEALLPAVRIARLDGLGVDSDAIEAVSFALFACEAIAGNAANLPGVTGARSRVVMGKISPGSPAHWRAIVRRIRSSLGRKSPARSVRDPLLQKGIIYLPQ